MHRPYSALHWNRRNSKLVRADEIPLEFLRAIAGSELRLSIA